MTREKTINQRLIREVRRLRSEADKTNKRLARLEKKAKSDPLEDDEEPRRRKRSREDEDLEPADNDEDEDEDNDEKEPEDDWNDI